MPTPTLAAALVFRPWFCRPGCTRRLLAGVSATYLAPALAWVVASLGLFLYSARRCAQIQFPRRCSVPVSRVAGGHRSHPRYRGECQPADPGWPGAGHNGSARAGVPPHPLRTRHPGGRQQREGRGAHGHSPDRVGAANWVLAAVLAGFAVILIEPIAGSRHHQPAGGACRCGRPHGWAGVVRIAGGGRARDRRPPVADLGVRRSSRYHLDPGLDPHHRDPTGGSRGHMVLAALAWRGRPPTRLAVAETRLPPSPTPPRRPLGNRLVRRGIGRAAHLHGELPLFSSSRSSSLWPSRSW